MTKSNDIQFTHADLSTPSLRRHAVQTCEVRFGNKQVTIVSLGGMNNSSPVTAFLRPTQQFRISTLKGTARGSIWVSDVSVNYTGSGPQERCMCRNTRLIRVSLTTRTNSHDERSSSAALLENVPRLGCNFRQDVQYSARVQYHWHRGHVS